MFDARVCRSKLEKAFHFEVVPAVGLLAEPNTSKSLSDWDFTGQLNDDYN